MKIASLQRLAQFARMAVVPALMVAASAAHAGPQEIVKKYMAAWNAHNYNEAALSFDYDVEYFDASVGTPQFGIVTARDNVIKFFVQAFPDAKWTMEGKPLVQGDSIAFRWVFTGKNTGIPVDCPDMGPTGKAIDLHGVSMIHTKNGRITYQGDFYDALTFRNQVGLPAVCPPPAAPAAPAPAAS